LAAVLASLPADWWVLWLAGLGRLLGQCAVLDRREFGEHSTVADIPDVISAGGGDAVKGILSG
jgi:hypothetical protein